MHKYPTVNFIGNKNKISDWIINCLPIKQGVVLDLFSGGCSVSYALKKAGFCVISNDALYSNYVIAKSLIENNKVKLSKNDFEIIKDDAEKINKIRESIDFLSNKLYFDYEVDELSSLIYKSSQLKKEKKYLFLTLLRRSMIRKIPYSRMNVKWEEIKKFRDEEYSYKKYGRYRHYHNIKFIDHINLNIDEYNKAVFYVNGKTCKAFNKDAFDCLNDIEDKLDLIYLDPPYPSTMNCYYEFYGFFDLIFKKTNKIKVDFTLKNSFLNNFIKLIELASKKSKYVAISLNNKCYPSCELILDSIKDLIVKFDIFKKKHIYKVTGKKNKNSNYEILLVCEFRQ